jgi:hypothetical protein
MPLFAVEMKHSPEMSPIYNDKVREIFKEMYSKMEEVKAKHEVKILSNLYSAVDHVILVVIEAPNVETVNTLLIEVGFVSFNTIKVRYVIPSEEIVKELLSKT